MNLYTETTGAGPDIVLLHGWGMHSGIWNNVVSLLAKNWRVTTIDLPGHGNSKMSAPDFDIPYLLEEITPLIPEQSVLMGWSLGGLLAMQLCITSQNLIQKLILVTSSPQFIRSPDWPCAMTEKTLEDFTAMLQKDPKTTLQRFLALQVLGSQDGRKILHDMQARLMSASEPDPRALQGGLSILRDTNLRPHLGEIKCPTLIIVGQHDTLVPAAAGTAMVDMLPDAQLRLIEGAGHIPFMSHPAEFFKTIKLFLNNEQI